MYNISIIINSVIISNIMINRVSEVKANEKISVSEVDWEIEKENI